MRYSKFMLAPATAGAALILSSAESARADFSGAYAPANWTFSETWAEDPLFPPKGSFVNDGMTLTLTGSNTQQPTGSSDTNYTITAAASGLWTHSTGLIRYVG